MYTKIELFGFADFYHRFATTGLTIDEMFHNWVKYMDNPRDINELVKIPKKLKQEIASVKPPATRLWQALNIACEINSVKKADVNGKSNKRELVTIRQHVCYLGLELGFSPSDFPTILNWERSLVYARSKKCQELAGTVNKYRYDLNELLHRFGIEAVTSYI